jgi:hypothetical protein
MSRVDPSLAAAVADHAARRPTAPAIRYKARGRWRALTWAALDAEVTVLARGLAAAGMRPGQRVWIVGSPGPRSIAFLFAVERAGGVPAPVDGTRAAGGAPAAAGNPLRGDVPAAPVAFVEDGGALDELTALVAGVGRAASGPSPVRIVFDDPRGLRGAADERLQGYESFRLEAAGASPAPPLWRGRSSEAVRALLLPIAWRDEALAIIRLWARSSLELCLAERQGNLDADLQEVAPRVLLGASGATTDLAAGALQRLPPLGTWRRRFVDWSLSAATTAQGGGVARTVAATLARALVVRPLRRELGLRRTRLVLVVGAEISAPARFFLHALGIRLSVVGNAFEEPGSGARVLALPLEPSTSRAHGAVGPAWREASVP